MDRWGHKRQSAWVGGGVLLLAALLVRGVGWADTLGNTGVGGGTATVNDGDITGNTFTAGSGFIANTFSVYVSAASAGANVKAAVYDVSGALPTNLLAQTGSNALTAGMINTFALPSVNILDGNTYYLAVLFDNPVDLATDPGGPRLESLGSGFGPGFPPSLAGATLGSAETLTLYVNGPAFTPTDTQTPTATPSISATETQSATATPTPTVSATVTPSRTITTSPTATRTASATPNGTFTDTPTLTRSPTVSPTHTISPTRPPSATSTPTGLPAASPSATATLRPFSGTLGAIGVSRKIFTPTGARETAVRFSFESAEPVDEIQVTIFSAAGRKIVRPAVEGTAPAYGARWDGRDEGGKLQPPGIYIYEIKAKGAARRGAVVLAR
jgi:hypothetical protein